MKEEPVSSCSNSRTVAVRWAGCMRVSYTGGRGLVGVVCVFLLLLGVVCILVGVLYVDAF